MRKKQVVIETLETEGDPDGRVIEVEVKYDLGGMNYFTGTSEARGYYVSCTPVKHTSHNGVTWKSMGAFTGTKAMLEPAKRFDAKKLGVIAAQVQSFKDWHILYKKVLAHVLEKNKLVLKKGVPA
jgi:hypothetical protein